MSQQDDLFSPQPSTTQTCSHCGGRGTVTSPYYLRLIRDEVGVRIEGAPEGAITAVVVGSASIFDATRAASEIAHRDQRPVAFLFIDGTVTVRPDDDPEEVARAWWIKFYGETPEQSAARC